MMNRSIAWMMVLIAGAAIGLGAWLFFSHLPAGQRPRNVSTI